MIHNDIITNSLSEVHELLRPAELDRVVKISRGKEVWNTSTPTPDLSSHHCAGHQGMGLIQLNEFKTQASEIFFSSNI